MLMKFFAEVRRRRVLQTIIPYIGVVWLILQVVSVIVPMLNLHPLVSTFVAVLLFCGFPVVLYLAWYFDFTSEGLVRVPAANEVELKPFGWGKWTVLMAILGVSIFSGYHFFDEVRTEVAKQEEGVAIDKVSTSIAVIPFRDQSPDVDQAYLAEGLAEELTALLGKISGLQVAASSSSFILAQKNLPAADIGRRLAVDSVLTGSVRLTGDRLRVRTELIDSEKGTVLWSETFSRAFTDVFAIESEIARSVVNLLEDRYLEKGEVSSEAKTASTDAYVIYLKGREAYRKQTTESMKQARKLFEQAIGLDPEYAEAYVALADTILMLEKGSKRFGMLDTEVAIELADRELQKAFVRDQNIARAYAIQGKSFELKQDLDMALSSYDKAIELNPSLALAHMWRFILLRQIDRHPEALESIKKAYELDPASSTTIYNLGVALSLRGQLKESEQYFQQLLTSFPESPFGHAGFAYMYFMQGQLANSLISWREAIRISPEDSSYRNGFLRNLATLGLIKQIRDATDDPFYDSTILIWQGEYGKLFSEMDFQLKANPEDPWIAFEAGWYQLLFGDKNEGIELLMKSKEGISKEEMFSMPMCSPAIEFAWALKQKNRITESQQIIARCEEQLINAAKSGLKDSFRDHLAFRLAAIRQQPIAATKSLRRAISNGWREWWTAKDPLLADLERTEELQSLFDFIDSELASEKVKAELLLASSDAE